MNKNIYFTLLPKEKNIHNIKGIKISYTAEKQIHKLIKKEHKIGIKLGIKKSGCAGMKYFMELATIIHHTDIHFVSKNILILVNFKNVSILDGVKIDFIKEGINHVFKFNNKNIQNFCGCGESFNLEY
ncbi:MAG: iron-sulfur cluster assembly accessory protein [Buchnera aphidicola (Floraphis choui)]